jgi:prolyl oligopeptidase
LKFDPDQFVTDQSFYRSKDGERVPLFVTYKKGIERNGTNPTILYGYGGFNIALGPNFSPSTIAWLEQGGVYAVANLRGGGEFGEEWHKAGQRLNKQNVFNDFIAAAEFLIAEKFTAPQKLAISGGSNGGLLVAACLLQRPELFAAAAPAVGVHDLLRFHKWTIGWAWQDEFGFPDEQADDFRNGAGAGRPAHRNQGGTRRRHTHFQTDRPRRRRTRVFRPRVGNEVLSGGNPCAASLPNAKPELTPEE